MSEPEDLIAKAEKKMNSGGGFLNSFFGSSQSKYEEASELYMQAANMYKLRKQGNLAGETFEKAASCLVMSEYTKDEASNVYVEAFKVFKSSENFEKAAENLNRAVEIFTLKGNFRRAASFEFELAQLYETDLKQFDLAVASYERSGDWYFEDQAESLANKAYLKVADISALNENYLKAFDFYKKVAKRSLNNNLTKWNLKEYFFKGVLCLLAASDQIAAEKALSEFVDWDPSFVQTREYQLLLDLIDAIKTGDEETYSTKLYEFDQFSKLDSWKTKILLKIKQSIQEQEDDIL